MRIEKNNGKTKEQKHQLLLSAYDMFAELSNLGIAIYLAFLSNSIICWIDNMVCFSAFLRATIVVIIFYKIYKSNGDKYNYGVARLEAFISFICDSLIVLAMLGLFGESIYGLFNPTNPTDTLLTFLILKVINLSFDATALFLEYRLCKKDNNKLKESELQNYILNTIHDFTVGITVTLCYFLRDKPISSYLSSIVSMLIIIYFIFTCVTHMKDSFKELADVSIPLEQQDQIFDIVLDNKDTLKQIESVNCHILNHIVHVDISVRFKGPTTFDEETDFLENVKLQVHEKIPNAIVRLIISDKQNKKDA